MQRYDSPARRFLGRRTFRHVLFLDAGNPSHPATHTFTANLVPRPSSAPPQRHDFTPTTFYHQFSELNARVLHVQPGDIVPTTSVDAGGRDERGVRRVLGGNPETGLLYIETAEPGDTLVVHLNRVRLNGDWAISDDSRSSRRGHGMVRQNEGRRQVRGISISSAAWPRSKNLESI